MQIRIESMACDGKGQVTSNMFKMTLCAKDCLSSTTLAVASSKSKLHREPSNYCMQMWCPLLCAMASQHPDQEQTLVEYHCPVLGCIFGPILGYVGI